VIDTQRTDVGAFSDDQLTAEMRRRGYAVTKIGRDVVLPGLLVYGDRHACVWRGAEARLTAREHAIVTALAQVYPRALTPRALRLLVWGDFYLDANAHCQVCYLGKKLPGLIVGKSRTSARAAYRLNLDGAA
jgi:hypothetical protein